MLRERILIANMYAATYAHRAKQAAVHAKDQIVENKSELTRLAATATVVGIAARVNGFKAGYEFAQNA